MSLYDLYRRFYSFYGPQGWWPVVSRALKDGRDDCGYLPSSYKRPGFDAAFEISVGAVLTQNTSWKNAERAVRNLVDAGLLSPGKLLDQPLSKLSDHIHPAGYYNVKARKLRALADFFVSLSDGDGDHRIPDRDEILSVWGVGPETADSISLYAFAQPSFVIDVYTRRILSRIGISEEDAPYDRLQQCFVDSLPHEVAVFNEYHALLVCHAKRFCSSVPDCRGCFLSNDCRYPRTKG